MILEALALQLTARTLLMPSLNWGASYRGHDGLLQRPTGKMIDVSLQSVYLGAGVNPIGSGTMQIPGVSIFAAHAFEVPATLPSSSLHDLLTIFLDATHGSGGILHVVNDTGGSSTAANPDTPVTVVSYP